MIAAQFPRNLIVAVPYKLHTVLTDNYILFTNRKRDPYTFCHSFDRVCLAHGIAPRVIKTNHGRMAKWNT